MRYATDRFAATVKGSHKVALMVQSWRGVTQLADDVPIADGTLTVTADAVPGGLSLTVPIGRDGTWDPTGNPFHALAAFGQRLLVARGVVYPDGGKELLDLGWFVITDAEPDYDAGVVQVTAAPIEQLLADAVIPVPLAPSWGTTLQYSNAVDTFAEGIAPRADWRFTYDYVPQTILFDNDALSAIGQVAAAYSASVVVDSQGYVDLRPIPDPASVVPNLTLSTGEAGVVAEWATGVNRDDMTNGYYVTGETPDNSASPVWGAAADMNPNSPTYWLGPFGKKLKSYSSPLLTTNSQCQKAARTMLEADLRASRPVNVTMVPDPRIERGDWIKLDTPTVTGLGQVTALTLPLTPGGGAMSLTVGMVPT